MRQIRIRRFAVLAAFALLIALAAAACYDGDDDDNWLLRYRGEPNHDDGALTGTLVREGNCLGVSWQGGPVTHIALAAARWDEDRQAVRLDGKSMALGDEVRDGGGFVGPTWEVNWAGDPDPVCIAGSFFVAGKLGPAPPRSQHPPSLARAAVHLFYTGPQRLTLRGSRALRQVPPRRLRRGRRPGPHRHDPSQRPQDGERRARLPL